MKKFVFVIVCSLIVSVAAFAQGGQGGQGGQRGQFGGTPEEQAQRQTETDKTDLKLTADQVSKVNAVNLTYAKDWAKLREGMQGGGGFTDAMRESMTKLETTRAASLEKILTKDQMDAYKKRAADRAARMGQGGQGGGQRRNQ